MPRRRNRKNTAEHRRSAKKRLNLNKQFAVTLISEYNFREFLHEKKPEIVSDLIRSAIASHGDEMIEKIEILSKHFNFNFELSDRYYGWNYEKNSPLREILRTVLKEKGIEMEERASHGRLECGIFKGMIPDLDIITYGPIAKGEHTPEEKLDLASFDRAYENLLEVLKRCK